MEDSLKRRIDFVIDLLQELKDVTEESTHKFKDIERHSLVFYDRLLQEDKSIIQHEVDNYQANMQKMVQLNYEIIETINSWYDFSKDPREMKQLLFPVKFWLNQRKLKKKNRKINHEIDRITVENRFIKEKITKWEHELERKALQQIKQDDPYQKYLQLIERKADLISDLKYLLPTLPLVYPIKLDIKDMDSFVEDLITIRTA